jgi:aryl-alcohol dehydrogenase-like predicted oxidoreductase
MSDYTKQYRQLGRTGLKVSPLCLGCMMFGERATPEESHQIMDVAIENGINFLDTADVYGRGASETIVGEGLKRNGKRDKIVLATKVNGSMDDSDLNAQGNSRRHIIQACEASLIRLQTDHIDLYQIHRPQSAIPIDETLRAMDDLIRAGKVRYIGTSTFAAWQFVESLWVSEKLGLNRFVTEQPPYNILDRRIERELIPMAQTYGVGIMPWSPLAQGMLTGKYSHGQIPAASRFDRHRNSPMAKIRFNPEVLDVVDRLNPLAEAKKCTLSQFALAWCLNRPGITCPIIGPRNLEQMEDYLKALGVEQTKEDFDAVDEIVKPGTFIADYYSADFGPHPYR